MTGRRLFRGLTFVLCALTATAVWTNVLSDDAAVRAQARVALGEAAGCGADCKIEALRGERGMLGETITYDVARKGTIEIVCRRELLVVGEHRCTARRP